MLLKELGTSRNEHTKCTETCKCYSLIYQEIINKHSQYVKINFNLLLDETNKCLPSMNLLPKFHKNSTKFRVKIVSSLFSLKPQLILKEIVISINKCNFFPVINIF